MDTNSVTCPQCYNQLELDLPLCPSCGAANPQWSPSEVEPGSRGADSDNAVEPAYDLSALFGWSETEEATPVVGETETSEASADSYGQEVAEPAPASSALDLSDLFGSPPDDEPPAPSVPLELEATPGDVEPLAEATFSDVEPVAIVEAAIEEPVLAQVEAPVEYFSPGDLDTQVSVVADERQIVPAEPEQTAVLPDTEEMTEEPEWVEPAAPGEQVDHFALDEGQDQSTDVSDIPEESADLRLSAGVEEVQPVLATAPVEPIADAPAWQVEAPATEPDPLLDLGLVEPAAPDFDPQAQDAVTDESLPLAAPVAEEFAERSEIAPEIGEETEDWGLEPTQEEYPAVLIADHNEEEIESDRLDLAQEEAVAAGGETEAALYEETSHEQAIPAAFDPAVESETTFVERAEDLPDEGVPDVLASGNVEVEYSEDKWIAPQEEEVEELASQSGEAQVTRQPDGVSGEENVAPGYIAVAATERESEVATAEVVTDGAEEQVPGEEPGAVYDPAEEEVAAAPEAGTEIEETPTSSARLEEPADTPIENDTQEEVELAAGPAYGGVESDLENGVEDRQAVSMPVLAVEPSAPEARDDDGQAEPLIAEAGSLDEVVAESDSALAIYDHVVASDDEATYLEVVEEPAVSPQAEDEPEGGAEAVGPVVGPVFESAYTEIVEPPRYSAFPTAAEEPDRPQEVSQPTFSAVEEVEQSEFAGIEVSEPLAQEPEETETLLAQLEATLPDTETLSTPELMEISGVEQVSHALYEPDQLPSVAPPELEVGSTEIASPEASVEELVRDEPPYLGNETFADAEEVASVPQDTAISEAAHGSEQTETLDSTDDTPVEAAWERSSPLNEEISVDTPNYYEPPVGVEPYQEPAATAPAEPPPVEPTPNIELEQPVAQMDVVGQDEGSEFEEPDLDLTALFAGVEIEARPIPQQEATYAPAPTSSAEPAPTFTFDDTALNAEPEQAGTSVHGSGAAYAEPQVGPEEPAWPSFKPSLVDEEPDSPPAAVEPPAWEPDPLPSYKPADEIAPAHSAPPSVAQTPEWQPPDANSYGSSAPSAWPEPSPQSYVPMPAPPPQPPVSPFASLAPHERPKPGTPEYEAMARAAMEQRQGGAGGNAPMPTFQPPAWQAPQPQSQPPVSPFANLAPHERPKPGTPEYEAMARAAMEQRQGGAAPPQPYQQGPQSPYDQPMSQQPRPKPGTPEYEAMARAAMNERLKREQEG